MPHGLRSSADSLKVQSGRNDLSCGEKVLGVVFLLYTKHIWGALGKVSSPLRNSDGCPFLTFGRQSRLKYTDLV